MKFKQLGFVAALLAIGLLACKKEDTTIQMTGTWEGAWGFDADVPAYYEKWEMTEEGGLVAYDTDGILYAFGSWTLDGRNLTVQYTPLGANYSYSFKGEVENGSDQISGTWGETPSWTDGGLFVMHRR